jgi:hypothetical protein
MNQPKTVVVSKHYYVVISTNIRVNRMARQEGIRYVVNLDLWTSFYAASVELGDYHIHKNNSTFFGDRAIAWF